MDEDFNNLYKGEQRTGTVFITFAALAIFIACLGLFGLAAYSAEQRTKEIGIRKVLGASVKGIISLLSKDFIRLVVVAIIIASPVAWWAMNKWLQDFAYSINISWWIFLVAGVLRIVDCIDNGKFPGNKSSNGKPGEEFKNGINQCLKL